jgi:hypothetical protein
MASDDSDSEDGRYNPDGQNTEITINDGQQPITEQNHHNCYADLTEYGANNLGLDNQYMTDEVCK